MQQVVDATGLEMTYVEVPPERFGPALVEIVQAAGRALRLDQHRGAVVRLRGGPREAASR